MKHKYERCEIWGKHGWTDTHIGYDEENFFVVSGEMIPQYSADEILESDLVEGRK